MTVCEQCKAEFTLNPRLGLQWAKKTGRGRFCSDKCSREARKGKRVSIATEFKKGSQGHYKNGKTTLNGYVGVFAPNHPYSYSKGYVYEHRLVMEKAIGRVLDPSEVVHHINKNPKDNRLENLILFGGQGEHMKYHAKERRMLV